MRAILAVLSWIVATSSFAADDAPVAIFVRGAVFDPAGTPVADASITILTSADESPEARVPAVLATGQTRADGSFEIPLAEAPYALRVKIAKAPFAPSLVDHVEPTSTYVEIGPVGLAEAVDVEGAVVDADGKPVANADVFARSAVDVGPWEATPGRATRSGADGTFRFERLPRAPLELGATKPGMRSRLRRNLDLREPNATPVLLILGAALPSRECIVLSNDGKPVQGATIVEASSAGAVPFFAARVGTAPRTDAEGRVQVELPSEPGVSFEVSAPAHVTRTLSELPKDGRILLSKGRLASVRLVTTAGTSTPIREVRIESYSRAGAGAGWNRDESRIGSPLADPTDAAAWIMSLPITETVRISVQAIDGERFAPAEFTASMLLADGKPNEPLCVDITRGDPLALDGVVLNPGGEPLAGERIELQRASPVAGQRRPFRAVRSGADGRFRFEAVPAGAYVVQGVASGAASRPVEATMDRAGTAKPVELRMESWRHAVVTVHDGATPSVLPRVVDVRRYEGNAREGAFVVLETTRTDAAGKATFTTLPAGELLVVAHAPPDTALWTYADHLGELPRPDFTYGWKDRLKPGESPTLEIEAPAVAATWILANVTENGAPAAGAAVSAILDRNTIVSAMTGPEGRAALRVRGSGAASLRVERGPLRAERTIQIEPGADSAIQLDLGVGAVRGRIVARDGAGIGGLRVALEAKDAADAFGARVEFVTGADGTFELPTLTVGTYRVVTADPQHAYAVVATPPFTVAAGEHVTLPHLAAPPAATVRVALTTPAGTRVPFATVTVTGVDAPLVHPIEAWCADGKADVRGLPPGKVKVALKVHGKFTSPEPVVVDVPEGGVADAAFTTSKT